MKKRPEEPRATITIDGHEFDREQLIEECEEALDKLLEESGGDFETYEGNLLNLVHEIARRKLQKKLQTLADRFGDRLAIDHTNDWHGLREGTAFAYRRHSSGTVTYHSLVGPLRVRRDVYRECHRRGSTYVPLELEAGLMERMTPVLARAVAIGYAHMPPRTCVQLMRASGLHPPSRSTLDRAARDVGAYAIACSEEIEPLVRANEIIDPRTTTIALGLDRVAVAMRAGEHGAGATTYCGDLRRSRPKPRPRGQIRGPVQWRMDYVGTVAFLDEDAGLLATRKYRLPADASIDQLVERMIADVHAALVQRPVRIAVVQDGAPELWRAINKALANEPLVPTWTEVLDWYHLDERLSKCLELAVPPDKRAAQRTRWHTLLLERDDGTKRVLRSLRFMKKDLDESCAEQLQIHINYLARNRGRTAYASCKRNALPIGSGITEGTCKSLVAVRAKRSGQRWSQRGLSAALHLRAIDDSDRFDSFWHFFSRRYRAKHIVEIASVRH